MNNKIYYTRKELLLMGYNDYSIKKAINYFIIEKVKRNIYVFTENYMIENELYTLQKGREFIYAGHTAAFLHNLTTTNPNSKHIIVKQGYNVNRIKKQLKERNISLFVTYVKPQVYSTIKDTIYWGDSILNAVNIEHLMIFLIKQFDDNDNWVNFEILGNFSNLLKNDKNMHNRFDTMKTRYPNEYNEILRMVRLRRW